MARPKAFAEHDALHAALETFWRKGYHFTSVQDLVDTMGINRASLYDTFSDKHALYLRALERYRDLNSQEMAEAVAGQPGARAKLQALFDRLISDMTDDADCKGCFMTNATLEMLPHYEDVQAVVQGNFEQMGQVVSRILREGVNSGELRANLPVRDTTQFMLSQIAGLRVLGKTNAGAATLEAVVRVAMQVLD